MAVYHPSKTLLRRQIDSLKMQAHQNWTCIIGVDAADPETADILSASIGTDERFEIHEFESRVGFYRNFERILRLAPRDVTWIALADQDDCWYPQKLTTLIPLLSTYSLVSCQARLARLDDDTILAPNKFTSRRVSGLGDLVFDNAVSGALCVFRPEVLEIALPFPKETDVAYHDHWLGLCALLMEGIQIVEAPLQDYVQHSANVIGERQSNAVRRFQSLGRRAGLRGFAKYLVLHRWKWRVNMCRAALQRTTSTNPSDREVLRAFARNRINAQLVVAAVRAARGGNVSGLRIAALLFGSLLAPAFERRSNEPNCI
ncbi:MAG: glycosyltransferase [Nitrospirota bacterium]|nr:glycosyltransferase [Nitrospirota bacterium]